MCPGKEHAWLEILVFLYNIVKKFDWELVFPDEKFEVNPLPAPVRGLRLPPSSFAKLAEVLDILIHTVYLLFSAVCSISLVLKLSHVLI